MNPFITYILQTTVAISMFYMIYWLFLRKETFFNFNRYYFIITIFTALTLPLLDLGHAPILEDATSVHAITGGYYYLEQTVLPPVTVPSSELSIEYSFADILVWVYIAVVAFLLFRLIFEALWFVWRIRKLKNTKIVGLHIVLDEKVGSPFSFFSWIFMNPEQINEKGMQEILLHEKEHIRQRHSLDLILTELIFAFQWFNPFVWLFRRSVKETLEYLADHAVLQQGIPVVNYQKLLLSYAMGLGHPALITPLNFSLNKNRMIMMKKMRSPGTRKWRSLAFLPLVLILGLAFSSPFTRGEKSNTSEEPEVLHASDSVRKGQPTASYYEFDGKEVSRKDFIKLVADSVFLRIRPDASVYVLNGKEISKPEFQSLDPESIKAVEVWKGDKAVEKYGSKAEPGAIIITTNGQLENRTQNYRVTGRVINDESNEPLPDVNIVVKNTSRGTVSGEGGQFSLPLEKASEEVYFTYIGFKPLNMEIKSGDEVEVRLQRRPAMLILPLATGMPWEKMAEENRVKGKPISNPEFVIVESMPGFPGGQQALSNYIASQIRYPENAKKEKISGRVWVNLTIDEEGNVRNVYLDRGIDQDLDKEAIRIISRMPKWKPGRQRGKAVPVELNINVDFVL